MTTPINNRWDNKNYLSKMIGQLNYFQNQAVRSQEQGVDTTKLLQVLASKKKLRPRKALTLAVMAMANTVAKLTEAVNKMMTMIANNALNKGGDAPASTSASCKCSGADGVSSGTGAKESANSTPSASVDNSPAVNETSVGGTAETTKGDAVNSTTTTPIDNSSSIAQDPFQRVTQAIDGVIDRIRGLVDAIKSFFTNVVPLVQKIWQSITSPLIRFFGGAGSNFGGSKAPSSFFGSLGDIFKPVFGNVFEFFGGSNGIFSKVGGFIKKGVSFFKSLF